MRIVINLILSPFRKIPVQVSFFYSPKTKKKINEIINDFKPDLIFTQLIRTAEFLMDQHSMCRVLDYIDVLSEGLKRRMEESNFIMKFFLNIEYQRVLKYEEITFKSFDKKIIITNEDKNHFPAEKKEQMYVIPNGVNTNYFKPINDVKKDIDLLFTGNMSYPPNVLAAEFLVKKILPNLVVKYPDIKVHIIGSNPSHKVLSLTSANVKVTGWVEDIRLFYSRAKIFVAPLKIGTGLQNKILEAMSMELPSITTKLVQKAIEAPEEVLLVAETPEEFANLIMKLLADSKIACEIGRQSRKFVKVNYNWDIVEYKLNELLNN